MALNIRTNLLVIYRLFFILMFLLLGVSCIGTVGLEQFAGMEIIETASDFDETALHTTLLVTGLLGIFIATIMLYLMQERRGPHKDRRRIEKPLDFTDRRKSYLERRSR